MSILAIILGIIMLLVGGVSLSRDIDDSDGDWYKDGAYWRRPNKDGSNGKGDLIFNTSNRIVKNLDSSEWAHWSLASQRVLLSIHARWPWRMEHYLDVSTWIGRIINRVLNKIRHWIFKLTGRYIGNRRPFRYRFRMSRDPYTAFGAACVSVGRTDLLKGLRPAWYIYRPAFWAWWNFIKTGEEKYLKRYHFWNWGKPKKAYVIRLNELREYAIKNL